MLMTDQPAEANQADSARVENRGPSTTTTVPPSWTVMPSASPAATATARSSGQYGSAKLMWLMVGPSKNVWSRPEVRSTSWSQTTKSPGATPACSEPEAHGPRMRFTPSSRSAQTFAR